MCIHPEVGIISLLYAEDGIDKWTTLTHWRPGAIDTRLATRTHCVVRAGQTTNVSLLLCDCSVLSFVLVACSHSGHAGSAKTRSTSRTLNTPLPSLRSLATMEKFVSKNRRSWQRSVHTARLAVTLSTSSRRMVATQRCRTTTTASPRRRSARNLPKSPDASLCLSVQSTVVVALRRGNPRPPQRRRSRHRHRRRRGHRHRQETDSRSRRCLRRR